jgi:hypothetical protein
MDRLSGAWLCRQCEPNRNCQGGKLLTGSRRSLCLRVGDEIHLHPTAPSLRIAIVDPPHTLILFGSPADIAVDENWG